MELDLETFKEVLKKQRIKAQKGEVINKGDKHDPAKFAGRYKYDPAILEESHIADIFDLTISQLETLILKTKDGKIIDVGNDYKKRQKEAMMYDPDFKPIIPQLAEFALGKFDKSETSKTDVIVELPSIDKTEYEVKISRLEKELAKWKK